MRCHDDLETGAAMSKERAVFWLTVVALLGLGIVVGQIPAVMVAAMVAIVLVYAIDRMPIV